VRNLYRWVEHTGELELEIEAAGRREVFEEGFRAMRGLLESSSTGTAATQVVELSAGDGAALLADWLAELAYLGESLGFVPKRLVALELGDTELSAEVEGYEGDPPNLVKGVTYHRLELEPAGAGWRARAVLDV
jgi:SHS2 domain-containing protein